MEQKKRKKVAQEIIGGSKEIIYPAAATAAADSRVGVTLTKWKEEKREDEEMGKRDSFDN